MTSYNNDIACSTSWFTIGRLRAAFSYVLVFFLFGLGIFGLYRLLAPVDIQAVMGEIHATPWHVLGLALIASLAGYLCLVGYEWSALSHFDKRLPPPVVLTGGFLAYAFGNTIGLAAVSGGAVRWRIYAGLGLDGYDIAAISTFTAVSFGLATTLVGLGALALHPEILASVLSVAPETLRLLSVTAIFAIAAPLLWASITQHKLKIYRFSVRTPRPTVLVAQLLIGLGDIGLSAMALHLLLPDGGPGFFAFLAVFAAATMAGVFSHVPGGVGVFETIMVATLSASVGVDKIAAALLLYRLIYFLIPFAIALVMLSLFEAWRLFGNPLRRTGPDRLITLAEPAFRAVTPIAPMLLAVMVFGSGLWMSLSSILPPFTTSAKAAAAFFPLAFIEGATLLTSALGALLIVLSLGLVRRSLGALSLTIIALMTGAAITLIRQAEAEQAIILLVGTLVLLPFRKAFHRRSMLTHSAMDPGWIVLMMGAVLGVGFVLFFAYKSTPYANNLWWQFAIDANAPRALRSGLLVSLLVGAGSLFLLLRAPRLRPETPSAEVMKIAQEIVMTADTPDAAFALTGDKTILLSDDRKAFTMFGISGSSWLAYGPPVGDAEAAQQVAFTFVNEARHAGARPVFYEIGPDAVPLMLDLGMMLHKIGEKAVVDLRRFSLQGPDRKKLRGVHARAKRDGLSMELVMPPHSSDLLDEMKVVSDGWLALKKSREKGFSVGKFEQAWLNRWPVAIVRHHGNLVGFANTLMTDQQTMCSIDLMRYIPGAPVGTMEFLFADLMLTLKDQGVVRFSLGMAPLSGLSPERSGRLWDRFGALAYRHGGVFYNFEGLRAFKAKFSPEWVPYYLATPSGMPPLVPLADAARLISRTGQATKLIPQYSSHRVFRFREGLS